MKVHCGICDILLLSSLNSHSSYVIVQHGHLEHGDAAAEIKRLQLSESCKRKASEDDRPLRQIFSDVCRSVDDDTAQSLSFAEMENAMYKRRRLAQPALPTSHDICRSQQPLRAARRRRLLQRSDRCSSRRKGTCVCVSKTTTGDESNFA